MKANRPNEDERITAEEVLPSLNDQLLEHDRFIAEWHDREDRRKARKKRTIWGIVLTALLVMGLVAVSEVYSAEPKTVTVLRGDVINSDGTRQAKNLMVGLTPNQCLVALGVAVVYPLALDQAVRFQITAGDFEAEEPWAEYIYTTIDDQQFLVGYYCEQVQI